MALLALAPMAQNRPRNDTPIEDPEEYEAILYRSPRVRLLENLAELNYRIYQVIRATMDVYSQLYRDLSRHYLPSLRGPNRWTLEPHALSRANLEANRRILIRMINLSSMLNPSILTDHRRFAVARCMVRLSWG